MRLHEALIEAHEKMNVCFLSVTSGFLTAILCLLLQVTPTEGERASSICSHPSLQQ